MGISATSRAAVARRPVLRGRSAFPGARSHAPPSPSAQRHPHAATHKAMTQAHGPPLPEPQAPLPRFPALKIHIKKRARRCARAHLCPKVRGNVARPRVPLSHLYSAQAEEGSTEGSASDIKAAPTGGDVPEPRWGEVGKCNSSPRAIIDASWLNTLLEVLMGDCEVRAGGIGDCFRF